MSIDFSPPEEIIDREQYKADVLKRLPLRSVHKRQLPGVVMHHTPKPASRLLPDDFCEKIWGAGRWLATYILKHPEEFKGKRVLDIGTGSGIVAIAAALTGAEVTAIDGSAKAICLTELNAKANGVAVKMIQQYMNDQTQLPDFDVLTTTDTMYSNSVNKICVQAFRNGAKSLLANRAFYICDQSAWSEAAFTRFRTNITAAGACFRIIKGGERFMDENSPVNSNPITAVRIQMAPQLTVPGVHL